MKKISLLLLAFVIGMGCTWAQSTDSLEHAKQQEALLLQQQKEQQLLLEKQQKEQAAQLKQQQKAEQAAARQLVKDQEKAEKQRQFEAAKAQKAEQKKAERKERRQAIGRKVAFTIDPEGSIATVGSLNNSCLYNAQRLSLGANVLVHYPLTKRWDLVGGLNYDLHLYNFSNTVKCSTDGSTLDTLLTSSPYVNYSSITAHTISIPIMLNHFDKKGNADFYLGIRPGFTFRNNFDFVQYQENGDPKVIEKYNYANPSLFNKMRLDVEIGLTSKRWLVFSPAISIYFNLLPTFTPDGFDYHELGVNFRF